MDVIIMQTLLPKPKNISYKDGCFLFRNGLSVRIDDVRLFRTAVRLKESVAEAVHKSVSIAVGGEGDIRFYNDPALPDQGYVLRVEKERIDIAYHDEAAAFWAVSTLRQILSGGGSAVPCLVIEDNPDFPVRGYMLDISRCKVPKRETLFRYVDCMADLKLNMLQLYIEGFSFAYPSFPQVWKPLTPLTPEDIMALDEYCRERYIDLVPCQNNFGHMHAWLARPEFHSLAERPDAGWPTTLNPLDEQSLRLVEQINDDLLPCFGSSYYNICCDETFELGQGRSKALADQLGVGRVYLDFLKKVYDISKSRGKTPMFWGDVIQAHPKLIAELPKDIIALAWGYEPADPAEDYCRKFQESGIRYFVSPGTSTWTSVFGRTDHMLDNVTSAAENGKACGASGLLNTEWGDGGHWQCVPANYAGLTFGAAMAWNVDKSQREILPDFLSAYLFRDKNNVMGKLALDFGNYYQKEAKTMFNITYTRSVLKNPKDHVADTKPEDHRKVADYIDSLLPKLDETLLGCVDAEQILREYRNSARIVRLGAMVGAYYAGGKYDENALLQMRQETDEILMEFQTLWAERNQLGRLTEATAVFRSRLEGFDRQLAEKAFSF